MQISYSILTHNETDSLQKLLDFLLKWKDDEDEIVILDDYSDNEKTIEILDVYSSMYEMKYEQRHLHKDFANQKNYLNSMCSGDYIMNLDADELPIKFFMKNIKMVLETNDTIDLFWIPRINTVDGITQKHIQKWGWQVNEHGWINFPDYQGRLYKKRPNIRWEKPVHEQIVGYREHTFLPPEKEWAVIHKKEIERQEKQNEFYGKI